MMPFLYFSWLIFLQDKAKWPDSSLKVIERFMHESDFYISPISQGNDECPKSIKFASSLRKGTEISNISNSDIAVYSRRFEEQVKLLSQRLIGAPIFILEYHPRGTTQKTAKFDRLWKRRGELWDSRSHVEIDENDSPLKKRIRPDIGRLRYLDPSFSTANIIEDDQRPHTSSSSSFSSDSIMVDTTLLNGVSPAASIGSVSPSCSTSRIAELVRNHSNSNVENISYYASISFFCNIQKVLRSSLTLLCIACQMINNVKNHYC